MTQGTVDENYPNKGRRTSLASQNSANSSGSMHSRDSTPAPAQHGNLLAPASAPHSRSCSFRNKVRTKELEVQQTTVRRNSMPTVTPNLLTVPDGENGEQTDSGSKVRLHRVRSFKTTSKGVVNRGDSFKKKSTHSLMSTGSSMPEAERHRHRTHSGTSQNSSQYCNTSSNNAPSYFKVIILGGTGVGKSTLARQFMTSEYTGFEGADGSNEVTVSVQLNGEESTIEFVDPPERTVSIEELQVDAYVVVFSITDHASFDAANGIVRYLRVDFGTDRAIVLVANKIDLVRKRKVSADEARHCAICYDCKYTETSAAINHHVDELLVGILSQIRLKLSIPTVPVIMKETKKTKEKKNNSKGARGLLSKLFKRSTKKSKSCDNLYAL